MGTVYRNDMPHSIKTLHPHKHGQESLTLPATSSTLEAFKDWLSDFAQELSLSAKVKNHLLIAVDEIVANIISYAYPVHKGCTGVCDLNSMGNHGMESDDADNDNMDKHVITLHISYDNLQHTLTLIFTDNGSAFNPLKMEEPNILAPEEERKEGGLGIFLVKKLMDSVEYKYANGQNILTLTKNGD